jgi:prephenate dehydratase
VLDHKRGSLAAVLNVLSDCKLNLTKIQSMPVVETPWKYSFFVDVTFDEVAYYAKTIQLLEIMTESLKVLGTYKNQRIS